MNATILAPFVKRRGLQVDPISPFFLGKKWQIRGVDSYDRPMV